MKNKVPQVRDNKNGLDQLTDRGIAYYRRIPGEPQSETLGGQAAYKYPKDSQVGNHKTILETKPDNNLIVFFWFFWFFFGFFGFFIVCLFVRMSVCVFLSVFFFS